MCTALSACLGAAALHGEITDRLLVIRCVVPVVCVVVVVHNVRVPGVLLVSSIVTVVDRGCLVIWTGETTNSAAWWPLSVLAANHIIARRSPVV